MPENEPSPPHHRVTICWNQIWYLGICGKWRGVFDPVQFEQWLHLAQNAWTTCKLFALLLRSEKEKVLIVCNTDCSKCLKICNKYEARSSEMNVAPWLRKDYSDIDRLLHWWHFDPDKISCDNTHQKMSTLAVKFTAQGSGHDMLGGPCTFMVLIPRQTKAIPTNWKMLNYSAE